MKTDVIHPKKVVAAANMAGNPFSRYKPEEPKEVRELQVTQNQTFAVLLNVFKSFRYRINGNLPDSEEALYIVKNNLEAEYGFEYTDAFSLVQDFKCISSDIAEFILQLDERETAKDLISTPGKLGILLSALINSGNDSKYFLPSRTFSDSVYGEVKIDFFGYHNSKDVEIMGDLGKCVGYKMLSGFLVVRGDVGQGLADKMTGGEIHVYGRIESLGRVFKGKIYQNGRLIVEDGRILGDINV